MNTFTGIIEDQKAEARSRAAYKAVLTRKADKYRAGNDARRDMDLAIIGVRGDRDLSNCSITYRKAYRAEMVKISTQFTS